MKVALGMGPHFRNSVARLLWERSRPGLPLKAPFKMKVLDGVYILTKEKRLAWLFLPHVFCLKLMTAENMCISREISKHLEGKILAAMGRGRGSEGGGRVCLLTE